MGGTDATPATPAMSISHTSQHDIAETETTMDLSAQIAEIKPAITRNNYDTYYNEIVVFKVEGTIFRAFKKAFLYPGSFFQTLFSLPAPTRTFKDGTDATSTASEEVAEGLSEENPIILEKISKNDFRSFLKVLIPIEGAPSCSTYTEWMGVLDLATMWEFPTIRQKAIHALTPSVRGLSTPDRIILSWKFEVKAWLIEAYAHAASAPIPRKTFRQAGIDPDTISGLYAVRDAAFIKSPDDDPQRIVVEKGACRAAHIFVYQIGDKPVSTMQDWETHYQPVPQVDIGLLWDIVCDEFEDELRKMRDD